MLLLQSGTIVEDLTWLSRTRPLGTELQGPMREPSIKQKASNMRKDGKPLCHQPTVLARTAEGILGLSEPGNMMLFM